VKKVDVQTSGKTTTLRWGNTQDGGGTGENVIVVVNEVEASGGKRRTGFVNREEGGLLEEKRGVFVKG